MCLGRQPPAGPGGKAGSRAGLSARPTIQWAARREPQHCRSLGAGCRQAGTCQPAAEELKARSFLEASMMLDAWCSLTFEEAPLCQSTGDIPSILPFV